MITADQIRPARALPGMDQRRLAEAAGLSLPTIRRMRPPPGTELPGARADAGVGAAADVHCIRGGGHDPK